MRSTRENFILGTQAQYCDHQIMYCSVVYSHGVLNCAELNAPTLNIPRLLCNFCLLLDVSFPPHGFCGSHFFSFLCSGWMVFTQIQPPDGGLLAFHYEHVKVELIKYKGTKATERSWGPGRT